MLDTPCIHAVCSEQKDGTLLLAWDCQESQGVLSDPPPAPLQRCQIRLREGYHTAQHQDLEVYQVTVIKGTRMRLEGPGG